MSTRRQPDPLRLIPATTPTANRAAVLRPLDVIDAPVKVARTAAGPVGYFLFQDMASFRSAVERFLR